MHALPHWLKPLVFLVCLLPLLELLYRALSGSLGVNPVETLHHAFGDWTLRFLLLTLAITPLRLIPGMNWLTTLRRMIGLFAFFYASLHVIVYIALDQQFDWPEIAADIIKRPYITIGVTAYALLIPLAITSSDAMMIRLGDFWKKLHKLIYLVTALGILHFYLMVKADIRAPMFHALIFGLLIVLRVTLDGRRVPGRRPRNHGRDT